MPDAKLDEIARVLFPTGVARAGLLRLGKLDRVDVSDRTVLARAGDPTRFVFCVLAGYVDHGHAVAGPGELLGDAGALVGARWTTSAVAHGDGRVLLVPAQRFPALLGDVPELNAAVMRSLSERVVARQRGGRRLARQFHPQPA
jgi:CRP-like cAMP-binding protein